jgi:hypothetical protein
MCEDSHPSGSKPIELGNDSSLRKEHFGAALLAMSQQMASVEADTLTRLIFGDNIVLQRFPSLQANNKRNSKKRRKRDKSIPMHKMTTSVVLKFKSLHFSPAHDATQIQTPHNSVRIDTSAATQQVDLSSSIILVKPKEKRGGSVLRIARSSLPTLLTVNSVISDSCLE